MKYVLSRVGCAKRVILGSLLSLLFFGTVATAQMEIGDNLSMTLNGSLGYSYGATYGNLVQSGHGQGFSGTGNLDGYYFHPSFLSFNFRPYYDRAQSSGDSQTITRGTGFGTSANLFGGSRFPGSISYGKDFSSNSEFQFAGVPSVLGDSSGQTFAVSWSALVPDWPQLWVNYIANSSTSTLLGTTEDSKSSAKNLNMNSSYRLAGFDLRGVLTHYSNDFVSPGFLTGAAFSGGGSGTTYGLSTQHGMPRGGFGLGWSHSTYEGNDGSDWTSTSYNAGAGITPIRRLSLNESFNYTTNISAALGETVLGSSFTPLLRTGSESDALFSTSSATMSIGRGFAASGNVSYRRAHFQTHDYTDTQYGGSVNYHYANRFLGFLYASIGMVDTANKNGNAGGGLYGNLGVNKKFGRWDTAADFSYSQNVQTMISIANTSSYNYGGSVRRKISKDVHWGAAYRASHSAIVMAAGTGSGSESFTSDFSWRKYSFSANYSQSNGTAILNQQGLLTATPLGSLISNDFLYFDARTYGFNVSARPLKRLNVSGGYTNVSSSTSAIVLGTSTSGERYNARFDYRLRRFSVQGGYDHAMQHVSTLTGPPRVINSYYLTLSRWFNVF